MHESEEAESRARWGKRIFGDREPPAPYTDQEIIVEFKKRGAVFKDDGHVIFTLLGKNTEEFRWRATGWLLAGGDRSILRGRR